MIKQIKFIMLRKYGARLRPCLKVLATLFPSIRWSAYKYFYAGLRATDTNDLNEAEKWYRRALALRPDAPEIYAALGNTLIGAGRLNEAEKWYRRALALRPDAPEIYVALGNTLIGAGRATDAIKEFRKALALRRSLRDASYGLAMALLMGERHEEAIEVLQKLATTFPDRMEIFVSLGSAYHLSGHIHEAAKVWAAGMAVQERLARAEGLDTNVRYLGNSWMGAIGHLALLDFFAKRQILGLSPVDRYV